MFLYFNRNECCIYESSNSSVSTDKNRHRLHILQNIVIVETKRILIKREHSFQLITTKIEVSILVYLSEYGLDTGLDYSSVKYGRVGFEFIFCCSKDNCGIKIDRKECDFF